MNFLSLVTRTAISLSLTFSLVGCGQKGLEDDKEDQDNNSDAPAPPSPYTLSVNLNVSDQGSDMDSQQFAGLLFSGVDQGQFETLGANHFQAMVYVLVVNVNVAAQLFVPVTLLKSAIGTIPALTATDTWTYSYTVTYNNRTWTANLSGVKLNATSTSWQMRVTSNPVDGNGCCSDFLFFEGQSSTTGSGTWQLYDPTRPADAAKIFSVTYDYKSQTDKVLLFTVNSDKAASQRFGTGSFVRYQIAGNAISLEISDSSEVGPGTRKIEWAGDTKAGSHTDPQGNKVCWDSSTTKMADKDCGS